jgi:hypothetical protein
MRCAHRPSRPQDRFLKPICKGFPSCLAAASRVIRAQKRQAEHIEEGYERRGVSHGEAERRAWATVNKQDTSSRKSGSGRGTKKDASSSRKGARLGSKAAARKPAAARSASAKKAAATRRRHSSG